MNSFLIISENKELGENYCKEKSSREKIHQIDIMELYFDKAIGIGDIRELLGKIYLKPFQSPKKSIIVDAFSGITIEAQNALLKTLEEPPENTLIFILSENEDFFLPTIKSRCKIVKLTTAEAEVEKDLLDSFDTLSEGERFVLAQNLSKEKEVAIAWLKKAIAAMRQEMIQAQNIEGKNKIAKIINQFSKTYLLVKNTNANVRMALENLFLSH